MQTIQTAPIWAPAVAVRLAGVGTRTVTKKKNGRIYTYYYLRFNASVFPEVVNAKRLRLVIVPPDFTAPPVIVTARAFRRSIRVHGFMVDAIYQQIIANYMRNKHVGVIAIEIIEYEDDVKKT